MNKDSPQLSAQIKRIDDANTTNRKSLTKKKAELNRLKYIHSYLHQIKRENESSQPRKQKNIKTQEQNL